MEGAYIISGISNIFVGMLIIFISMPLAQGKVPMNKIYGVLFKKAFKSEKNWYEINAHGGKLFVIWSILLVVFGVVVLFLPIKGNHFWITRVACAPLILLIPTIMSYFYAKKL